LMRVKGLATRTGQLRTWQATYTKGAELCSVYTNMEHLTGQWRFTLTFLFPESYSFKNAEVRNTFPFTVMNMRALLTWWRRPSLLLSVRWTEPSTHPYTKHTNMSPLSLRDKCERGISLRCLK
jgi:hypothetical protein